MGTNMYIITMAQQWQTKIGELGSQDNEFTSVRVGKTTLGALAKSGKFGDTFENIIQRMIVELDDKIQATEDSF